MASMVISYLSELQVRAEHVCLGLLREGSGMAAMVLKKLGVRAESVRAEILKETDPLRRAR